MMVFAVQGNDLLRFLGDFWPFLGEYFPTWLFNCEIWVIIDSPISRSRKSACNTAALHLQSWD